MLTRRALVASCVVLGVAGGCSSSHPKAGPPSKPTISVIATTTSTGGPTSTGTGPASTATAPASSTTTSLPVAGPSLGSLIATTVPSGWVLQPDAQAETGPTNLAKAAGDDVLSSNARAVLVSAGFVAGYQRQWEMITDNNDQNFIFLYEFSTPAGAQAYVRHWQSTIQNADDGAVPVPFTPIYVPAAVGLRAADKNGSSGVVLFAKGPYAVQALVTGGPNVDQSAAASALALAQYARLP